MATDKELTTTKTSQPKKGRGGKYNFPNSIPPENKEDIQAALSSCLKWYKKGAEKCKTDEEIEQRTIEFFEECLYNGERPTVEKYCLSLGYSRQTINEWEHNYNNTNSRRADIIKKAKEFLASFDADMVSCGKLQSIPYIFRAKNYYGMSDNTQVTIETKQNIIDISADEIAEKYKELPE